MHGENIKLLEDKVKVLEDKVKVHEDRIKVHKDTIRVHEEKSKVLEDRLQILEKESQSKSKIMRCTEVDMVYKWVSEGKVFSHLNLLLRGSVHGFEASTFHEKCHGHGPLICFVR